jgi:large subunit ribosomal protein L4
MSAKSLTVEDAQAANLVLVGPEKGRQAVHDLVTAYRANRRTGSACTKTRGEVSGNNKKIFKQKGTGNARHGDKRAPIFVGGGVVFGPRPRDYSKKVTKTVRKLALRRVLGDLVRRWQNPDGGHLRDCRWQDEVLPRRDQRDHPAGQDPRGLQFL